jgi:hypothetical protein
MMAGAPVGSLGITIFRKHMISPESGGRIRGFLL